MFLIACWSAVGGKTQEGDGKGLCGVCLQPVPTRWFSQGGRQEASVYLNWCSPSLTWHSTAFQASHWGLLQRQYPRMPETEMEKWAQQPFQKHERYKKCNTGDQRNLSALQGTPSRPRDVSSRVPASTVVIGGVITGAGLGGGVFKLHFVSILAWLHNNYQLLLNLSLVAPWPCSDTGCSPRHAPALLLACSARSSAKEHGATRLPPRCLGNASPFPAVPICISMPELGPMSWAPSHWHHSNNWFQAWVSPLISAEFLQFCTRITEISLRPLCSMKHYY